MDTIKLQELPKKASYTVAWTKRVEKKDSKTAKDISYIDGWERFDEEEGFLSALDAYNTLLKDDSIYTATLGLEVVSTD